MDREQALEELSTAHAVALRLRDAGASDREVARALGIPVQGVPAMVGIAESKLAVVLGGADLGTGGRVHADRPDRVEGGTS